MRGIRFVSCVFKCPAPLLIAAAAVVELEVVVVVLVVPEIQGKFGEKIRKNRTFSRGPWEVPGVPWEAHGNFLDIFWIFQFFCFFFLDFCWI